MQNNLEKEKNGLRSTIYYGEDFDQKIEEIKKTNSVFSKLSKNAIIILAVEELHKRVKETPLNF